MGEKDVNCCTLSDGNDKDLVKSVRKDSIWRINGKE